MTQKKQSFPPAPERGWEDGEDSLPRVWALLAEPSSEDSFPSHTGGWRHLKFQVVSVVDIYDDAKKRIRNPGTDAMSDLQIYSQGDQYDPDRLYGYGLQYSGVHHADAYKLRAMHSFLSTFERRMDAIEKLHGSASDFVAYVVRLCQVLKVRYLIVPRQKNDGMYDDGKYRFDSLYERGSLDGKRLSWKLQTLVRDLWTDADRAKAAVYQEQKAAENKARAAAEAEREASNG